MVEYYKHINMNQKRTIIFLILNIVFLIVALVNVNWRDKEQYLYDLIIPGYAIINFIFLYAWFSVKNITIKKMISIFNIFLSLFLIFLFVGGLMVSSIDDSYYKTLDCVVSVIFLLILIFNISIFKNTKKI